MNALTTIPASTSLTFGEMERLGSYIAKSKLFGIQTVEQALVLMAISQAEGRHPALAARDYDIIQGKPAKKAEAMMRDFMSAGGKIEWHQLDDTQADATFSHPQGGQVRIGWTMERARVAGLGGKDMWKKFPRQMLRSRTVSEGVRTVFPLATSGMYVPEELADTAPSPRDRPHPGPTIDARAEPMTTAEVLNDGIPALDPPPAQPKRTRREIVRDKLAACFSRDDVAAFRGSDEWARVVAGCTAEQVDALQVMVDARFASFSATPDDELPEQEGMMT